jgi:hypothetical protein
MDTSTKQQIAVDDGSGFAEIRIQWFIRVVGTPFDPRRDAIGSVVDCDLLQESSAVCVLSGPNIYEICSMSHTLEKM